LAILILELYEPSIEKIKNAQNIDILSVKNVKCFQLVKLGKDLIDWFLVFNATFSNISVISWRSRSLFPRSISKNWWPV